MTQYRPQVQPTKRSVFDHFAQIYDIATKLDSVKTKLLDMGENKQLVSTIMDAAFDKMVKDLPHLDELDFDQDQGLALTGESTMPIALLAHGTLARIRSGAMVMDKFNKVDSFFHLMAVFVLSVWRMNGTPIASTASAISRSTVREVLHQLSATEVVPPPKSHHQVGRTASDQAGGAVLNGQYNGYPRVLKSMDPTSASSSGVQPQNVTSTQAPTPVPTALTGQVAAPSPSPSIQPASVPPTQHTNQASVATGSNTANAAPTQAAASMSDLSWEDRSQRLITKLGLTTFNYLTYENRTYFYITTLAKYFAPTIKGPAAAANKHARMYGVTRDKNGNNKPQDGVSSWIMTLEAFKDYVLAHFSEPARISF
ncbi:hypothetical protein BCR44DRAFT_96687 [Catenaria anguillulae PL171]|uniref:Uncharacterized protein n=1 Tax=Catenaria anguillulae PL171 TaxID=765915 RepID=A0A1Y2HII2_9FUNG|nr:hypothetical protein BCR44DRAFT_96687 [Catenaria anguillulae PL171]